MQLGKYQLIRKLASGGMAEVFLAKAAGPMGFEKTLVLKRILPHLAEDEAFVEMFLGEAKLAAQLNHPNIVQIFDFGEAEGSYFLAMEFIDGPHLRRLIKRSGEQGRELPVGICAKLVASAAEGLAFAHELVDPETGSALGLIHRDVSPENVLVSRQGSVKVVDFGIAKVAGQGHRTQTGVVKGKVAYMPPEQLQGRNMDRRVDVYALGVVLYELLTGRRPFDATTEVSMMQAILFEPFVPAVQRRPGLPVAMQRILDRVLEKDREARYPDCRALQSDLERFLLSEGEPVGAYQIAQFVAQVTDSEGGGGALPSPVTPSREAAEKAARAEPKPSPAKLGAPAEKRDPDDRTDPATPAAGVKATPPGGKERGGAPTVDASPGAGVRGRAASPSSDAVPASPGAGAVVAPAGGRGRAASLSSDAVPASPAVGGAAVPNGGRDRLAKPSSQTVPVSRAGDAEAGALAKGRSTTPPTDSEGPRPPKAIAGPRRTPERPTVRVATPVDAATLAPPEQSVPSSGGRRGVLVAAVVGLLLIVGGVALTRGSGPTEGDAALPGSTAEPPSREPGVAGSGEPSLDAKPVARNTAPEGAPLAAAEEREGASPPIAEKAAPSGDGAHPAGGATAPDSLGTAPGEAGQGSTLPSEPMAAAQSVGASTPTVADAGSRAQAHPTSPTPEMPTPPPAPKVAQRDVRPSSPPSVRRAPPPPAPVRRAMLEFRIRPYATVFLDGKNLGQTPLDPVEVTVGMHVVRLVNRDLQKEVTRQVEVKPGDPTLFKLNLQAE
ncbi:protein kinase [Myxococcaceae bacterium JPH2]|nr:protein kinase [Myxococcaceae bacterium JPH2]